MKKFLSIFVALAMVLSLFAGVGARTAKAAAAPITEAATGISLTDATLHGLSDDAAAGHSFWVSLSTIDTTSATLPTGVYSTPDLGTIAASTQFSALLSSAAGLPAVTASTTYYFVAWCSDGTTWTPGTVMSFTTAAPPILVTGITVTGAGSATTVVNGGTLAMSAAVVPANATDATVTWSVAAGTGTATIGASTGVLTATGVGTVTVTATAHDASGKTGTEVITVTTAPTLSSIAIAPATVTLAGAATQAFVATATYRHATTATVTATYTATLGTFSGSTYTAPAATVATQTATVTGTYLTKTATATVTILGTHLLSSIAIVPATVTLAGAATQAFVATATYSDATTATVVAAYVATLGTFGTGATASTYTAPAATVAAQTATVTGTYTEGAVTKTATAVVTILGTHTLSSILQALKALYKKIGDTAKLIRDKVKADKAAGKDLTAFTADLKTAQKYATHRAVSRGIMLTEAERTALAAMQTNIRTFEQDLKTLQKIKTPKATKARLDALKVTIKAAIAARTAKIKTIHTAALTQYSSRLVTLIADATRKLAWMQDLLARLP
jgi:hypothetical protein